MSKTTFLWIFLVFLSLPHARAAAPCMILTGAQFLEPATGEFIPGSQILIRGERIAYIGDQPPGPLAKCRKIKLASMVIIPGLIDSHTHLLTTDRSFGNDFSTQLLLTVGETFAQRKAQARKYAHSLLLAGITSIRDLGNSGRFLDVGLQKEFASKTPGPRLFTSGPGLAAPEGQFPAGTPDHLSGKEYTLLRPGTDFPGLLKEYLKQKTGWLKIYADNDPNPSALSYELLEAAIQAAHAARLKVAVHATSETTAEHAVKALADSIEHGPRLLDTTLQQMAERRIFLVPTHFSRAICKVIASKAPRGDCGNYENHLKAASDRLRRALEKKVPVAFGSDMYLELENAGWDRGLYAYVEAGMTPLQALQTATVNAAELLQMQNKLGTLQVNAYADLLGVQDDPSKNIRSLSHVLFVMKNGRIIYNPKVPTSQ